MENEKDDFFYRCRMKEAEGCCLACEKKKKKEECYPCTQWKCKNCIWYLPDNEGEKCGKKLRWERNLKKNYKSSFKDYLKPVRPSKTQAIIQEYGK